MTEDKKAPDMVVLDHHHDSSNNVYKLTLGLPVQVDRPKVDDEGNPVLEKVALRGPDGEVAKDWDGKPIYLPGAQLTETVTEYVEGPNFVFADDDERYEGKSPEEIASLQRADVKKELARRERAAKKATTRKRKQLPGAGEAL